MGARTCPIVAAAKGSPDWMGWIAIVVDDEVGMASLAIEPALNLVVILGKGDPHGVLRGLAVGPCGGRGNLALAAQTPAEFIVSATDVLAQGVASGRLVLREVAGRGGSLLMLRVGKRRRGSGLRGLASQARKQPEADKHGSSETDPSGA